MATYVAFGMVRDWQERKRPFSNSRQFKKKNFSNSLILDIFLLVKDW